MMRFNSTRAQWMNVAGAVSFVLMLVLNGLANLLPINGLQTGQISDQYANYFAPISFTFSIWAVIYTTLAFYVAWRLKYFRKTEDNPLNRHLFKVDIAFTIGNLANSAWILAWHNLDFVMSLIFMVILLISLMYINLQFKKEFSLATIPFRIYFGWITVATVANVTTMIVANFSAFQWLWNGGEVSEQLLTMIILLVAIAIGNVTTIRQQDYYYGTVILWALLGIFSRHALFMPEFGILGIRNLALAGSFLTLFSIVWTLRHKFTQILRKN